MIFNFNIIDMFVVWLIKGKESKECGWPTKVAYSKLLTFILDKRGDPVQPIIIIILYTTLLNISAVNE